MQSKSPANGSSTGPGVLFVDDEPQSVKYFVRAFGSEFPIYTATSAAAAELTLSTHGDRIGVLVTDQRMPSKTGVELLDHARRFYPLVVRVLTTAYADLESAVAAVNRGEIHRYILKPWDITALRGDLQDAMELYRRRRHEQELVEARRQSILSLAGHVAHEMGTPLTSIRMLADSMEQDLPRVLASYRHGRHPSSVAGSEMTDDALDALARAPAMIRKVAERASMLMQLILVNAGDSTMNTATFRRFPLRRCVDDALKSYAFAPGEAPTIAVEGEDFEVWGSEVLMTFVLYNLLKNAIYAIRTARHGTIWIGLQPGSPFNRLLFRDTGTGIPEDVLPRIFDEFFTASGSGQRSGMGLPFCRRVMDAFQGHIECRSEVGRLTELELSFPHPEDIHQGA
jgi:two-component system response regulator PhcR